MKKNIIIVLSLVFLLLAPEGVAAARTSVQSLNTAMAMLNSTAIPALRTPILVSPANNTSFYHHPRDMTLAWKPVPGANSYLVEIQFSDPEQGAWYDWYNATVQNASYTFSFVGDQPGRWRVTALDSTGAHSPSRPSVWWVFDYATKFELGTPILVSPANNTIFYHYPRDMTLAWTPVPGADRYLVEIQYYDPGQGTWHDWYNETVLNASYTFSFVGMQPGRWRVTALGADVWYNSSPSDWWTFDYKV